MNCVSTSCGTITALPGMAFSSFTLRFIGMLRKTGNSLCTESWIVDSGATHHVTHDKNFFEGLSDAANTSVTLPTSFGVQIAGIGRIKLSDSMVLNNVLFIPDFRLNFLSVSQITKDLGYRIAFDPDCCMIKDLTKGLMIGKGDQIANLYVLDVAELLVSRPLQDSFASVSNVVLDSGLWHHRLGHPSMIKTYSIIDALGLK